MRNNPVKPIRSFRPMVDVNRNENNFMLEYGSRFLSAKIAFIRTDDAFFYPQKVEFRMILSPKLKRFTNNRLQGALQMHHFLNVLANYIKLDIYDATDFQCRQVGVLPGVRDNRNRKFSRTAVNHR